MDRDQDDTNARSHRSAADPASAPEETALRKLRGFMLDLEPDERAALARLIAPGVEKALADDPVQEWTPDAVQRWLKGADGRRRGHSSD